MLSRTGGMRSIKISRSEERLIDNLFRLLFLCGGKQPECCLYTLYCMCPDETNDLWMMSFSVPILTVDGGPLSYGEEAQPGSECPVLLYEKRFAFRTESVACMEFVAALGILHDAVPIRAVGQAEGMRQFMLY